MEAKDSDPTTDYDDLDPVIAAYMPGVDRTLLRENLKLTVDQRFEKLFRLQQFAEELRRAGQEAKRRP